MANPTGSISSTNTSTSHTLTSDPFQTSSTSPLKRSMSATAALLRALEPANRYTFIQPSATICDAATEVVKETLDDFAAGVADEQSKRLKEQRRDRKRKRGNDEEVLRIRKVYTKGFAVEQVWEQASRVIDALRSEVERGLEELGEIGGLSESEEEEVNGNGLVKTVRFDEDGFEVESEDESLEVDADAVEDGSDDDALEEDMNGETAEFVDEDGEDGADMQELLHDMEGEDDYEDEDGEGDEPAEVFEEDSHGLNDGFFSIDAFNKQTEFLERQDAAADPYTGEASDEEDIDWDMDPMAAPAKPTSSSKRAAAMDVEEEESDEDDEEGGPTFGNADLNAPEGDSDDGEDYDMDIDANPTGDNTNEILYKDFFEPPPRKLAKGERQAAYLARQERKSKAIPADDDATIERAMTDVRRDLFDDLSENDSDDPLSDLDPADPKSRKSAHERRQAKLSDEIRRLEAASVAKREWTLSGEARAKDRPLNSLLEEDLGFERTGKPIPVITAAVSESIEELIKRRILAQEFDEVIRRRPDADSVPASARRGAFELSDNKAQQSLAEMYEEDHIKATNPDTYTSAADEKLKKQHLEIEGLWKDVSAKLDSLSSWHYKPKPAAPSLTVVSDVATIAMEDAQPTIASGMAGADSMLAPQEIYNAKTDASKPKTEILAGGAPVARQEMTREEKLRRRRREKERIKKRGGEEVGQRKESKKTKEKRETVGELKRGGVKVIGRRGEVRDVEGNKIKDAAAVHGAGGFKL